MSLLEDLIASGVKHGINLGGDYVTELFSVLLEGKESEEDDWDEVTEDAEPPEGTILLSVEVAKDIKKFLLGELTNPTDEDLDFWVSCLKVNTTAATQETAYDAIAYALVSALDGPGGGTPEVVAMDIPIINAVRDGLWEFLENNPSLFGFSGFARTAIHDSLFPEKTVKPAPNH
jgi:hypothetical protein